MTRRSLLSAAFLVLGLWLLLAFVGPGSTVPADLGVGPAIALADATPDTPTSTATSTVTRTPTPTPTPTATVGPPTHIELSLSANPITCGSSVTIFAAVTSGGDVVADGTSVFFASSLGGSAHAFTSDGLASVSLTAPATFSGTITVFAQAGLAEDQVVITVVCPLVPAQMTIVAGSSTVACGTSTTITVAVSNSLGQAVPNGTTVVFSASVGTITQFANTVGGQATANYTAPANTSGTATIQATSAGLTRQLVLSITCGAPTAAPPAPTTAPAGQVGGQSILPRAGQGPDPARSNGLLYAGVAFVGAGSLILVTSMRRRKAPLPAEARLGEQGQTRDLSFADAALLAGIFLALGASVALRRKR